MFFEIHLNNHHLIFFFSIVSQLLDSERQTVTLMVSTDGGSSFKAAKLPVELQERSYTILDTSENSVMLHVNHGHSAYSVSENEYKIFSIFY